METRRTRGKRIKYDIEAPIEACSENSDSNNPENLEDLRKSKIRDSNKEYAKRMTILQTWSDFWSDYTTREGDAYPKKEALSILKKTKKILCPIESCRKAFTTFGGLRYHYARCNIERCFKCNACTPPHEAKTKGDLLRHMIRSHHNEMPALDDEQNVIAKSYLVGTGRAEKAKKRIINCYETQMNCRQMVKSYYDMIERTYEPVNHCRRPYKDWQCQVKDWELINDSSGRIRYIPPERESPHIKTSTTSWCSIKAGESMLVPRLDSQFQSEQTQPDLKDNFVFFTGGMSSSAAWLPKPPYNKDANQAGELIAISVQCCAMDKGIYYKDCQDLIGCIQFWLMKPSRGTLSKPELSFMIGHHWGSVLKMCWCPLGASWVQPNESVSEANQNTVLSRAGLLALACGDGQVRLISVPHPENLLRLLGPPVSAPHPMDSVPLFRVKPTAILSPPGSGQSSDYQTPACTSICWNLEDNQRLLAVGYSNGSVALFDLANYSPILYSNFEHYHIYRPYKSWFAHGLPVTGIALLSSNDERAFVATGGRDRHLKIWNPMDLNVCLVSDRAPITGVLWDYRLRGVVSSTEPAFTSFQNRVSYRYPTPDGNYVTITIATHRASVSGLANSVITSSLATSDEAGEVFIAIYGRPIQKRDRNPLAVHSIYTILPRPKCTSGGELMQRDDAKPTESQTISTVDLNIETNGNSIVTSMPQADSSAMVEIELDENNEEDVYGHAERKLARKPAKFLLPLDHRAVETHDDFKNNFGLEYVEYDSNYSQLPDQTIPESCRRAGDLNEIYYDRVCDFPFSSIKHVSYSPNPSTFSCLVSVSQVGLCRIDRIGILDQMYKSHVDSLGEPRLQSPKVTA